jgi:hypothetical protein
MRALWRTRNRGSVGTSGRSAGPAGARLGHDERESLRGGLALLDYADPGLADRAARFVLDGTGGDVLLELGARPAGELSVLLGEPGRLTDLRHHDDMWWEINGTLKARARLYRALPAGGVPAAVLDALVRLGQVLEAADAGHSLDDPGAGAPRWLQYLVNDALVAALCGNGHWDRSQVPQAVDVVLVAALLACDGSFDPGLALRVGFECAGVADDIRFQPRFLDPLVRSPAAARFLRDHHEQVDELPARLSGIGRSLLARRIGDDPDLLPEFAELVVTLAVDPDPQVHDAASPYLDRLPEPRRVEILLPVLEDGDAGRRREAVGLLARCASAAVLAPLREAAAHEPNARVRHALTSRSPTPRSVRPRSPCWRAAARHSASRAATAAPRRRRRPGRLRSSTTTCGRPSTSWRVGRVPSCRATCTKPSCRVPRTGQVPPTR